jgi:hypothetical protein
MKVLEGMQFQAGNADAGHSKGSCSNVRDGIVGLTAVAKMATLVRAAKKIKK